MWVFGEELVGELVSAALMYSGHILGENPIECVLPEVVNLETRLGWMGPSNPRTRSDTDRNHDIGAFDPDQTP